MTVGRILLFGADVSVRDRAIVLVVASAAGGVGGVTYYGTDPWRARGGLVKTAANVLTLLVYCAVVLAVMLTVSQFGGFTE